MNNKGVLLKFLLVSSLVCGEVLGQCSGYECLKAYVDKPDSSYKWTDSGVRLEDGRGWTGYLLNFTSQTWLSPELVSRSEWWHQLLIIVPDEIKVLDTSTLWITGKDNDDGDVVSTEYFDVQFMADVAISQGMTTAVLFQVPNQPIVFSEDILQDSRKEDAIIAFTWWHFLNDEESNAEYLLRLPMTKAAVKAMDTVNFFLTDDTAPEEIQDIGLDPTKFIIGGASKRGWTTWSTSAVDPRVIGSMPTVMDELNFIKNLKHHWMSLGGWTFQFEDYWKLNLTLYFEDPKMQTMFDIVDTYEYRENMMMPKLVICAANDEFFLPTDSRYWWFDMPDRQLLNRMLMLPNSGHSFGDALTPRLPSVNNWIQQVLQKQIENIPQFDWSIVSGSGDIVISSELAPTKVELWSAISCNDQRRDWRKANIDEACTCGTLENGICFNEESEYSSEILEETSPGQISKYFTQIIEKFVFLRISSMDSQKISPSRWKIFGILCYHAL